MSEQDTHRNLPLAVLVQPDPMLEERAGPWRTIAVGLAACAVVVLVLYGMSRPEAPQQMAAGSETSQTAPAGGSAAANNNGGQGQQTRTPQPNGQQPTTTGSGQQAEQPKPGKVDSERRSDSATSGKATAGPSDKTTPQK
jgi:hypothetical protein